MHFIRLSWCFNAKQELSVDEYDLHVRSKTWPRVKGNSPVPKSCQVSQWSTEQPLSFKMLRNISMFNVLRQDWYDFCPFFLYCEMMTLFYLFSKMTLVFTCTPLSCNYSVSRLRKEKKKLNGTEMCRVCFSVWRHGLTESAEWLSWRKCIERRYVRWGQSAGHKSPFSPRRSRSVHEDIKTSSHLPKQPPQTDRKEQTSNPLNQIHNWLLLPRGPTVMSAQPLPVHFIYVGYM